jgi:hypothetical protein
MSFTLRIVDDVVELDRQRVARLLPKLALTLIGWLKRSTTPTTAQITFRIWKARSRI